MGCGDGARPQPMARRRLSATAGSAGAGWGSSRGCCWNCRRGRSDRHGDDGCHTSEGSPHGREPEGSRGARSRFIGRTKGGLSSKMHALADARGVCGCPLFGKHYLRFSAGSSIGRVSGLCVWPSMTPRAGMLFGRLGSHRFRELQALEPRV